MRIAIVCAAVAAGRARRRVRRRRLVVLGHRDGDDGDRRDRFDTGRTESVADVVERVLTGVVNLKTISFDGSEGEASGVVIDRRGVIVTNNHVVNGARTITISFNDGRHTQSVAGEVIGTAPERDLAIIRVRSQRSDPRRRSGARRSCGSATQCSRSASLSVSVVARPSPRESSRGSIARSSRTEPSRSRACSRPTLRSTPATPAAHSSTPPDRLVGINTAAARAGSAENVGFAIAIDEARPVIDEIRSKPADQRAWLGVTFDVIDTAAAAVQLGLPPETRGAVVIGALSGQPRHAAGLRRRRCRRLHRRSACDVDRGHVEGGSRPRPRRLGHARRRRPVGPATRHRHGRQAATDLAERLRQAR